MSANAFVVCLYFGLQPTLSIAKISCCDQIELRENIDVRACARVFTPKSQAPSFAANVCQ